MCSISLPAPSYGRLEQSPSYADAAGLLMYSTDSAWLLQGLQGQCEALFGPEMSISVQQHHPNTGDLNSETSGDSKNAFLHCARNTLT